MRITILEDMIKEKLLEERAKEVAVSATDEEVEAAVQRVKAQYNLSTDADFDAALADSGMTRDDIRRQMRETITLQKVIGRDVASRLDLSDDALRAGVRAPQGILLCNARDGPRGGDRPEVRAGRRRGAGAGGRQGRGDPRTI